MLGGRKPQPGSRHQHRNVCAKYGLEVPGSKRETPTKMIENERVKILWDFQIQTDQLVKANQSVIVVVDKHQRTVVMVDVSIPSDSNIRKREHKKIEKRCGV